jgi:hypothetical protein
MESDDDFPITPGGNRFDVLEGAFQRSRKACTQDLSDGRCIDQGPVMESDTAAESHRQDQAVVRLRPLFSESRFQSALLIHAQEKFIGNVADETLDASFRGE